MSSTRLAIGGMSCGSCTTSLEKALSDVPGVTSATVSLATNEAVILGTASTAALIAAVVGAGKTATEVVRGVKEPTAAAEAETLIGTGACVVNFCAAWAEPCAHLNTIFAELAKDHGHLSFVQLDADAFPELCERFALESVPAFLFLHSGKLADSVLGADVPALVNKVKQHDLTAAIAAPENAAATAGGAASSAGAAMDISEAASPAQSLDERLHALTHKASVVLFMKGTPDAPRCGFSRQAVALLQEAKVKFDTFDILSDEEVRQGLKTYSNWPTYPQLYGDGKLLGGIDIMKELQEEGELVTSLPASASVGATAGAGWVVGA